MLSTRSVAVVGIIVAAVLASATTVGAAPVRSTPTWSELSPPTSPPGLRGAASAYDPLNGTVVVFGGITANGRTSSATWVWDGSTWTMANPGVGSVPPARAFASMAFDSDVPVPQLVLYGGETSSGQLLDDTWSWNGSSWFQMVTANTPGGRYGAALGADDRGHLVLYGGYGTTNASATSAPSTTTTAATPATTVPGSTSTSTGRSSSSSTSSTTTTTTPSTTTTSPSTTAAASTTTDTSAPSTTTTTTPAPSSPPSTGTTAAAAGVQASAGVVAATASSTTASDTAAPTATTAATSSSAVAPAARSLRPSTPASRTAAADGSGEEAQTADTTGPHVLGDTWLLEQTDGDDDWVRVATTGGPSALIGATLTAGPDGQTVLFGGSTVRPGVTRAVAAVNRTWVWDGTAWRATDVGRPPQARVDASVGYDPSLGGLVLFGGLGRYGVLDDTWLWNGATWLRLAAGTPPAARRSAASAFDVAGDELLVLGGAGRHGVTLADTVLLSTQRPKKVATSPTTGGGTTTSSSAASHRAGSTASSTASTSTAPARTPPTKVRRGDVITLTGSGFVPHATIVITFHSKVTTVGRTRADASGSFQANVTVPDRAAPGDHHFEASGMGPSGLTTLYTPVDVVGVAASHRLSATVEVTLVGIAVAVPVLSWFALGGALRLRRRPRTAA